MTRQRMVELLEIEGECVLLRACGTCNRYCAECELLQDDTELHEMYEEVIALVKSLKPVAPVWRQGKAFCGKCGREFKLRGNGYKYCPDCGSRPKWR